MKHILTLISLLLLLSTQLSYAGWFKRKSRAKVDTVQVDSAAIALARVQFIDSLTQAVVDSVLALPRMATLAYSLQDSAITPPPTLEMDVDSLLNDWYEANQIAFIDTISPWTDSIAPPPSDSLYTVRLAALPTTMELPYNPIVKQYIESYTGRLRQLSSYMLGLSAYYYPMFEEELERMGAPLELKHLPIIESALNPSATSRAGAAGLWQFMTPTARFMGLEVNSLVDERRDPMLSTHAAIKYLQQLYSIYNDWSLAIAAYNCGPGNVNKALRRAGGKRDYWAIYYYLPRETRGYVPAFIAANYLMNYYQAHGIMPAVVEIPAKSDTIQVHNYLALNMVADSLQIPLEQLQKLNPQYREAIIPASTKGYPLCLPQVSMGDFIAQQDSIEASCLALRRTTVSPSGYTATSQPSGSFVYHKIRSGESLSTIAERYGVGVSTLKRWNGLYSNRITAGKSLRIYGKSAASTPKPVEWKGNIGYYTVVNGDNLWLIAQRFKGVSVENIKRLNNLASNSLKIGQVLKIPKE